MTFEHSAPQELILPSNPAELARLRTCIQECSGYLLQAESFKSSCKDAIAEVCEELNLNKKLVNKMLRAYHKQNKDQVIAEAEQLEEAYTKVFDPQ